MSKPPATVLGGTNVGKILSDANAIPFSDSIQIKTLEAPKFNIEVISNVIEESLLTIDTKVTAVSGEIFEADELVIHTAVIETAITQEGGIANNVLKKMLPDAAGHTIGKVFDKGAIEQFNTSWEGKHIYESANLIIVVFIQNRVSKKIYQVAYLNAPITENIVTGIEDFGVESELIIYPQPASDEVILKFDSKLKHNYTWKIVDQRGVTLQRGKFNRGNRLTKIETSQFPSGLYFMYVKGSNNEVVRKKFVIAH